MHFKISLIVSNKKEVGDYEAAALLKDLKLRTLINVKATEKTKGHVIKTKDIKGVSSAKVFDFYLQAADKTSAKEEVLRVAKASKVYLPMVNDIEIDAKRIYLNKEQLFALLHIG